MTSAASSNSGLAVSISCAGGTQGVVLIVAGELDLATSPDLAAMLDALVDQGHVSVTLDCSKLEFIDASGVGVLAATQARLLRAGGGIRLRGASPMAYRILEFTDLLDVLQVEPPGPDVRRRFDAARDPEAIARQANRLASDSARADALSRMTGLIPEIIIAAEWASVTLRRPDYLMTAAANHDAARDLDNVQYADRQGPCVEAATTGVQTHSSVLARERRWRRFTPLARGRGVEAILSSPLVIDGLPIGALNLYSRTPHAFLTIDQELANVFAAQAAMLAHKDDRTTGREFDDRIHDDARQPSHRQTQGIRMERHEIDARGPMPRSGAPR